MSLSPTGAWGGDALLFMSEKIAMNISGRWLSIQYRQKKDLEWDVAPLPRGKQKYTLLASKTYAIPSICPQKELAFKFLMHLISPEDELLVANYGDGIPSIKDIGQSKQFLYNPQYPNERNNRLYLEEMKHARVAEYSPYISQLDVNAVLGEEFDTMWAGKQSADEACERAARRINAIIKRNIANPNLLD